MIWVLKRNISNWNKQVRRHFSAPAHIQLSESISSPAPGVNSSCLHHVLCSVPPRFFGEQWDMQGIDIVL